MVPSHVLLNVSGTMSMSMSMPSLDYSNSLDDKLFPVGTTELTTVSTRHEDDVTGCSDSPSRVSDELLMTVMHLQQLQVASTTCLQVPGQAADTTTLTAATSPTSTTATSSSLDMPLIRRNLSLDSAQDYLISAVGKPAMIRRWTSTPPSTNEAILRQRRFDCESMVRRLYEDRKERIMEIFQHTWILSDPLDDEEEDDADSNAADDDGDDDDEEEEEVGEEEQDDG
jgi:hypothetical protein